ncbi:amino acid permease-domain-containing protein [Bombardia bombarda]|uniref:Amino acid permease-domain-containing protein n=1 Tax=Bombardia bombarda TaxID=252184 RepID=A0AA40CED9_9PEZI|nr:amino acid permease-domain-containing protein [Bombardia bombarda]
MATMEQEHLEHLGSKRHKLGVVSGVYIPVCLNIVSILMFLRFGLILGQVGLLGMLGLMLIAYTVDFVTTLSLSAIASNGEVKGGGAYYLISRSLGPEFGGSIGLLFYLAQVLNTALNVVGLIDCLRLNLGSVMPHGYWWNYLFQTFALIICTGLCLAGSSIFAKASNALLVVLTISILSIPLSALFCQSFIDPVRGIEFTGVSLTTLRANLFPHSSGNEFDGLDTFRDLFGILFPATSGIFAGASMSGDLRNPSKDIPVGTLWAMLSTFIAYLLVILSLASSTTHSSFLHNGNVIQVTNMWPPIIFAGEFATTFFSALMGVIGSAKLMQALARDKLFPGLSVFGKGTRKTDEPLLAIFLTYIVAQFAMFANLNQIATLISMGYQMTFFVMNLACFLLKIGSAPNFRPGFKFFTWQTAFTGSVLSAAAMFFIDETYATTAVCLLVFLFLMIHYLSPPKHWGDVSQNLIYHQVRKYLLRLKPEHIKFWRPQIILLVNNPRKQTRLIQFCNSMKKGALYILGHVIVTDDFSTGVTEAKLQQAAWTKYISEYSRIKAFVQLTMSPSITWGVRNLVLSAGLGGMRPNIAVMGFYNMDDLRGSRPDMQVPEPPLSSKPAQPNPTRRRRGDTSARLLDGFLPTDVIKEEEMMTVTSYLTILEDLALRYRLNVAIGKGFETLETPRKDGTNTKQYIDLWPIQMSAELSADGKSVLTTNFDTYTLILQLGYILRTVPAWKKVYRLRVLVFVEYENEVEEERGRVKALLEKLRIEAEVLVFWLASGQFSTYEIIIHGHTSNPKDESIVNECLKDEEWWEDLQSLRGSRSMTSSQEFNSVSRIVESASGRPPPFSTHSGSPNGAAERRRPSWSQLTDLPKKPTVSQLARLGVNMGIHTQNLPVNVFDSSDTEVDGGSDTESNSSEGGVDGDFNDTGSVASDGDLNGADSARVPLLAAIRRRRSYGDVIGRIKSPWKDPRTRLVQPSIPKSYGTVAQGNGTSDIHVDSHARAENDFDLLRGGRTTNVLERPPLSRTGSSAMRFSSMLVPETRITNEGDSGPKIMFSNTEIRTESATISRQSSVGQSMNKLAPATRFANDEGENGRKGRKVSFQDSGSGTQTPARSRRNSTSKRVDGADSLLDIPELLSTYQSQETEGIGSGSTYSTQGLSLSFNDLPSRAQHLILNELMRQNSSDTAVLFTTLPIPEENTCQSEEASLTYLSNIEVLCNELPPMLLVLSNNMTVTVSL